MGSLRGGVRRACALGWQLPTLAFFFDGLRLWVVHDQQRSSNLLDQQQRAASIALGAAIENIVIAAAKRGYCAHVKLSPKPTNRTVAAELTFEQTSDIALSELTELFPLIRRRATNRRLAPRIALPAAHIAALHEAAAVHGGQLHLLTGPAALAEVGQIIGAGDQIRFLCRDLHRELIAELRWTSEEAQQTGDGVDMATLELTEAQRAMLQVIARPDVAAFLSELGGGAALTEIAAQSVTSASAVGLLSIAGDHPADLLRGGRAVERLWLQATALGLALHPMITVLYMFEMLRTEAATIFTEAERATLGALEECFDRLFPRSGTPLLLFRIAQAPAPTTRAPPANRAGAALRRATAAGITLGHQQKDKDPADPIMAPIAQAAARAKAHPSWHYHELPTGHVPWETMPQALARLLHESAQPFPRAA